MCYEFINIPIYEFKYWFWGEIFTEVTKFNWGGKFDSGLLKTIAKL